jgi:putative phosphoribosyl transferase
MIFENRREAGQKLAERLLRFKESDPVVLALVRGGLPIGYEIAKALSAPLDIVLVRKIGAPYQPEFALGAVVDGDKPEIVVNPDVTDIVGFPRDYIAEEAKRQLAEIERRRTLYLQGRARAEVKGKTAIVVDDGIATGSTTRAALHSVRRQQPARLVLAVPVAPPSSLEALRADADEVVCLDTPEPFVAIGCFYKDFHQVEDAEVIALLDRARTPAQKKHAARP